MNTQDIKTLREATGAGMMDCKKALEASGGNIEKAKDYLITKFGEKAKKNIVCGDGRERYCMQR